MGVIRYMPGSTTCERIEEKSTMLPCPCAVMIRPAACSTLKLPFRFRLSTRVTDVEDRRLGRTTDGGDPRRDRGCPVLVLVEAGDSRPLPGTGQPSATGSRAAG